MTGAQLVSELEGAWSRRHRRARSILRARHRTGPISIPAALLLVVALLATMTCFATPAQASQATNTITNTGFVIDTLGQRLDAHDGTIVQYRGLYYLFGTSYECSIGSSSNPPQPYCGVKVYWSHNLAKWVPGGVYEHYFAFDPRAAAITAVCPADDCFRPHVVYNSHTHLWVMWINSGFIHGYVVLTSRSIRGPYAVATSLKTLGAGSDGYGDEAISVDGTTAWLVYTERIHTAAGLDRDLVLQRLDASWTGVAGHAYPTRLDYHSPQQSVEAPALFKRRSKPFPRGLWYLVYSDPSCSYCTKTGSAYATSRFPWGPWTYRGIFNSDSCGGQPAAVDILKGTFVWQVDRWAARGNQYNARNYLAPLRISWVTGLIPDQSCVSNWTMPPS